MSQTPSFRANVTFTHHNPIDNAPMDLDRLNPRLAGTRLRQAQDAKKMQTVVEERLNKKGLTVPPYEFLELIGKGAYGRVYKR